MRPRIDCARTALSPRVGKTRRATKAWRSRIRRSRKGPMPARIWPVSSAQSVGFHNPHEIAERLNPGIRGSLATPQIEQPVASALVVGIY